MLCGTPLLSWVINNITETTSPDLMYWPWGVFFGWPMGLAFLLWGRRRARSLPGRAGVSFAVACAVAPAMVNYGGRAVFVHAFCLGHRLPSGEPSDLRLVLFAGLPSILIVAAVLCIVWHLIRRSRPDR
jgi:hypothetical protein